jgi:hypothetical protein
MRSLEVKYVTVHFASHVKRIYQINVHYIQKLLLLLRINLIHTKITFVIACQQLYILRTEFTSVIA